MGLESDISMTNGNGNGRHTSSEEQPTTMNAGQFAAYIEKRLSIEDAIELIGRDGLRLQLRVHDAELTADLSNFYSAYARDPAQLDTIVRNFISATINMTPDREISDFAALADKIYPMLKPIALLVTVRERGLPMLAYREFLADLIITYVIDEQRSVAYINEDHLDRWGVDLQEVHAHAIANLRRRTHQQVDYIITGEGEQRIFIFNSGDGYDATRLLLADVLTTWARELPGHLVIGVPNRDFMIGFSDANPDILQRIAQQVQADAAAREYGITDQLFTLDASGIREYEWE